MLQHIDHIIQTDRLVISKLAEDDHAFIQDLLNTEGWIKFIGNRNIHSREDAVNYINKIKNNPATEYWTVTTKEEKASIGLVTLIQRDYLLQPDIGFAFLPAFEGKGYATEASRALLDKVIQHKDVSAVHAVIVPSNKPSIRLIERLGFSFEKEILVNAETLAVYTIQAN
jgi:[ribosomal protein S5]-alanine N-acetyltransferase